ncbi:MAG: hypothetical protein KIT84_17195 [Labilithrix sp.]|nr:hypothetical protein [Labilithrix sp.]MCW5812767.1 hypothetical protein [Labilithrix sp.]
MLRSSSGFVVALSLAACVTTPPREGPPAAPSTRASTEPRPTPEPQAPAAPMPKSAIATPEDVWSRVAADVTGCYEAGRKVVPEMLDGRITFHAAIDREGKSACVVPSDDTGLTQEVEDCMRVRVERETFRPTAAEWTVALPIVVRGGAVSLGQVRAPTSIETIESRGLSEELYDVIEGLLPDAKACLRGAPPGPVVVGAQVKADGAVACALAASASALAPESRRCVADVFTKARFKPPKRGIGLLSVPIEVLGR